MVWELIFMMVILKIPIAYLCGVVYWAVKAEPNPPEPAVLPARLDPDPFPPPECPWRRTRSLPRRPPRGGRSVAWHHTGVATR